MKIVKELITTSKVKDNNLKSIDKIMLVYNTAYKYETPYKGPFVITYCLTNGTVIQQYGTIKINHNIRPI